VGLLIEGYSQFQRNEKRNLQVGSFQQVLERMRNWFRNNF